MHVAQIPSLGPLGQRQKGNVMDTVDLIIEATESGKLKWTILEYKTRTIKARIGDITLAMELNPNKCGFEEIWAYDFNLWSEVRLESTREQVCKLIAAMNVRDLPSKANTLIKLRESLEAVRKE